ncbi:efflux transporter outer membrane subunit [Aquabacterium sp.]|uniref:efflux transporter outer membrane subunit n=1 Tax=Aquabacterium sp. TaxID=1872578 RepID=UPI003784DC9F
MRRRCSAVLVAAALAGCAQAPQPLVSAGAWPEQARFRAAPAPDRETPPAPSDDVDWGDAEIDRLVQQALSANAEVEAATARLAEAGALLDLARAQRQPSLAGGLSAARQGGPLLNDAGSQGSLLQAGASLRLDADAAGALARAADAAGWRREERAAQLAAARWQVATAVAAAGIRLRGLDAELTVARDVADAHARAADVARRRLAAGTIGQADTDRLEAAARAAEAEMPALQRQRQQTLHALAVLLGRSAGTVDWPAQAEGSPRWPEVPAGLPAAMLARRPDVQAAARALAATEAGRREVRAAAWPTLTLTAGAGQASASLATLLQASLRTWSLGALLTAPLFDGGRQAARERQADAAAADQLARYRQQVLLAFQDAEDQLVAVSTRRAERELLAAAAARAVAAQARADQRWQLGLASQLEWLEARQAAGDLQRRRVRADTELGLALVGLRRALGGGWTAAEAALAQR